MTTMNRPTALVLGATGGIGGEMAATLLRRGWRVKALARDPAAAASHWCSAGAKPEWVPGDALDATAVASAARDATLVVHAANPPQYRHWDKLVLPMLENTIAAARPTGARILLPGNVYNYGRDAYPLLTEASPQRPATRKGSIRVRLEQRLQRAAEEGIPSLIVRAGDFFGPRPGGNWFGQCLVKPKRPVSYISYPGTHGVGHQWAYLPDVAETMARLLERSDHLEDFETFHMEGHWDQDGTRMIGAIRAACGDPQLPVRRFPWWLLQAASPFISSFRELVEMRDLWRLPVRMSNARLLEVLGQEPHTPWQEAVESTLIGMGCLPGHAEPV